MVPFLLGAVLRKFYPNLSRISGKLVLLNLTIFEPPLVLWSIWGLSLRKEMIVLPVAGLMMVVCGFLCGKGAATCLKPEPIYRKAFVISASLANHGFTMGGAICYLVLGEKGLALASIFILYFIPYTFLFIFFYAGIGADSQPFAFSKLLNFLINIRNMPLFAALFALLFGALGVPRPALSFPIMPLLSLSIGLYYFTLGTNFDFSDLNPIRREHGMMAGIKFLIIPLLTFLALRHLSLEAELKQVIRIQSFMPAAVYSVVTSVLFNLDTRLTSSLFVVNSLLFIFIGLPVWFFIRIFS